MMRTFQSLACAAFSVLAMTAAFAQGGPNRKPPRLPYETGEEVYRKICQGCHMPDGKGAVGAGRYPALAENARLAAAAYPALTVLEGRAGMPPFRGYLDDGQVAAVVNFVRTSFGNRYTDTVTADDVKKLRR